MGTRGRVMRREILQNLGALGVSGILLNSGKADEVRAAVQNATGGSNQPRALALVGDRFHAADYIRVALSRLFRELNLPVDFTINFEEIDAARLQNYRLLVIFRDGLNWPGGYLGPDAYPYASDLENSEDWPEAHYEGWITEEQGKAIREFVQAGNGLYA